MTADSEDEMDVKLRGGDGMHAEAEPSRNHVLALADVAIPNTAEIRQADGNLEEGDIREDDASNLSSPVQHGSRSSLLESLVETDFRLEDTSAHPALLKALRLHAYTAARGHLPWQNLVQLTEQELEQAGVASKGARGRLLAIFRQIHVALDEERSIEMDNIVKTRRDGTRLRY